MFEGATPDALISEIEASQRQESALMAHRLAAIAALLSQRIAEAEVADPDPGYAMITGFARTTAEVSAAMNMSPMGANHLVAHAEALDTRLPNVAALLAEGTTDWRTVQLIITRTELVSDDLIAQLDQFLAERIGGWQCWSRRRIINAADATVRAIDPDAAKERRVRADDDRHISVTPLPDGMALGPRASWGVRGGTFPAVANPATRDTGLQLGWLHDSAVMCCRGDLRSDSRVFHTPNPDLKSSPWLRVDANLRTVAESTERLRSLAENYWAAREAMRPDNSGYLQPDGTLVKDVKVNPHLVKELAK